MSMYSCLYLSLHLYVGIIYYIIITYMHAYIIITHYIVT